MSETAKKENPEMNETEKEKKTAAKKPKEKTEEKKPNVFKRGWRWCKSHKKEIGACAISFGAGVGTAVGGGYLLQKRDERRARNAYIPPEQVNDDNSLDPNVY
jgi:hypothetical protein